MNGCAEFESANREAAHAETLAQRHHTARDRSGFNQQCSANARVAGRQVTIPERPEIAPEINDGFSISLGSAIDSRPDGDPVPQSQITVDDLKREIGCNVIRRGRRGTAFEERKLVAGIRFEIDFPRMAHGFDPRRK